ncbi:MAG: methyltransferase [Anaerolineales bacterium]
MVSFYFAGRGSLSLVVDAALGPDHHVRRPMYMAILIFMVGTSLLRGSWYGLIFVIICMAILARRAVLEEQMLLKELLGYADYKA